MVVHGAAMLGTAKYSETLQSEIIKVVPGEPLILGWKCGEKKNGEEICPGSENLVTIDSFVTEKNADFLGKGHLKAKTQQDCGSNDQVLAFADASTYIANQCES